MSFQLMHLLNEYTECSRICSKSLDGMLLILTLFENEIPLQVLCENLA